MVRMTKKHSKGKKKTKENKLSDERPYDMTQFNPEICKLKHLGIDKELKSISDKIDSLKKDLRQDVINANENLKNKVILSEKMIGEKLDVLNDFDNQLRGNGDPGVWESVRGLKWRVRILISVVLILLLLVLGGTFRGVSLAGIKKIIGINTPTEEVDEGTHIYILSPNGIGPDEIIPLILPKISDSNELSCAASELNR